LDVQGIVQLFRFFKGFPSMPKGEIVGMFTDRRQSMHVVIDGKIRNQHDDDEQEKVARSEA
jgi:hypothetical protein